MFELVRKSNLETLTVISPSVLGWVPGIITMVVAGILFWITSITMHKYIMKYPQIKDICKSILQPHMEGRCDSKPPQC